MKCIKCKKEVKKDDHKVVISTLNRPHGKDDHAEFHWVCFVQWYNEAIEKKARIEVDKMREKALGLMNNPMIRGVLERVGGGEMLQQMLGTPLVKRENTIIILNKKQVADKIQNEREKREKTKRSKKL
jgi:hypothetical protein